MVRRLGRGLDFLLAPEQAAETKVSQHVPVDRVDQNPWQPRQEIDQAGIDELAESLRRVGVIQPIVVRRGGADRFQLVAGQRRLLAAQRAGMSSIPAIIRDLTDDQMPVVALIENIHREDLRPLERAQAFRRLSLDNALSHEAIAELTGIARSTVTNSLRLLDLDPASLRSLQDGKISEGHARALLAEPDLTRRSTLLSQIEAGQMSVRKTEVASNKRKTSTPKTHGSPDAVQLARQLSEKLATKVEIAETGSRGRIVVHYSDLDEFERLFTALVGVRPEVE